MATIADHDCGVDNDCDDPGNPDTPSRRQRECGGLSRGINTAAERGGM